VKEGCHGGAVIQRSSGGDAHGAARFLALHLGCGAAFGRRLLPAESAIAMRTLTTRGRRLTTGLGWWRRHDPDDAGGMVEHLGGGGAGSVI